MTVERSASNSIIAEHSNGSAKVSVIVERSASYSVTAERSKDSASGSIIAERSRGASSWETTATKISAQSVKKAIKAHTHVQVLWKSITYCVIVTVMLASFATEVHREVSGPGITTGESTDNGTTMGQWGYFCTGSSEKCTVFQVQPDKIQQQCSVQLQKCSETLISTKKHASNEKIADHNASAKLEEALGKLQQTFADNAEAEARCKSVEKEHCNVERTERQVHQAIL